MFKWQCKRFSFQLITILLLFIFVSQANALTDRPLRSLTTQLEANLFLSNIQELRLDGVTSTVTGGIVTLYNLRAISDTTTLNDYLEVDFLFDAESLRLIPVKLEKTENLGIYYRDDYLFSKDVSANIFLETPSGDTLSPDQFHRLNIQAGDEFIMYMEAGTVLTQQSFNPSDDYYGVIEGPDDEIVSRSLYEANSRWTRFGMTILKSGNYIIRFLPENDTSLSLDYSVTNNNRSTLQTLVSGSSIQTSLNGKGNEYAKYKITLNAGDLFEVTDPVDDDVWLKLVNENSELVENSNGKIFYRVSKAGDYYLFVVNTDANNGANYSGTINITPDPNVNLYPILTKIDRQYTNINDTFTLQLIATNTPDSYSAVGLPDGLSVDKTNGLISGTPTISGTFSIQITVENEYGKDQQRFLLTINETQGTSSPSIQITSLGTSVSTGIVPISTQFALEASGGSGNYQYLWDFGDETTSTERAPAHIFTQVGDYNIIVTVTDAADVNSRTTGQLKVIVTAAPPVYSPLQITLLSASVNAGIAPLATNFEVQVTGGSGNYNYHWDFDDETTSTERAPTHSFTDVGNYNVIVTVTDIEDENNSTTGQLTVTATVAPSAFSALQISLLSSSVSVGNAPLKTDFKVQATGGSGKYEYLWDFGDEQSSTTQSPSYTFTTIGTYDVNVAITAVGELSIIVNNPPESNIDKPAPSNDNNTTTESSDESSGGGGLGVWFLFGAIILLYRRVA